MPAPLPAPPWRISCTAQLATCHPLQHASPARLLPPLPPRTARASASVAPALPTGGPPRLESGAYSTGRMQGFGNPNYQSKPSEPSKVSALASSVAGSLSAGISKMTAGTSLGNANSGLASSAGGAGGGYSGGAVLAHARVRRGASARSAATAVRAYSSAAAGRR